MNALPGFPGFRTALSSVKIPSGAFGFEPPPAEAPTNPDAGLYRLPNELMIQVLASCPDFSTLWSLICTSRTLSALFDANDSTIVEGILQQAVPLPLAGILRATVRAHLGTLCGGLPWGSDPNTPGNHLVWTQSPPFRRHEVPTGLLRNVVRLAHDTHVLAHLYLEERLQRCAAMPSEPPRWALAPPSANEAFRVEMCLWRAQLLSPFAWDDQLPAEDLSIVDTRQRSAFWADQLRYQARPREYWSLEQLWKDMGWEAWLSATAPSETDGMIFSPPVGPLSFPMQVPDPEPMACERYGSVWALLRRCTCCGSKVAAESQAHILSDTDTPSWAFYGRLLSSVWTFPSNDKIAGIRQRMRSFGLPFWDEDRMVALGFPVRKGSDDFRDYTTNFGALYTENEFKKLAISSSHRRRASAEDLAREMWALSHVQDYRCDEMVW